MGVPHSRSLQFPLRTSHILWPSQRPHNAYFLNNEGREIRQVRHEQRLAYMGSGEPDWNEIKLAFLDPKVWLRYFFPIPRHLSQLILADSVQRLHAVLSKQPLKRLQHLPALYPALPGLRHPCQQLSHHSSLHFRCLRLLHLCLPPTASGTPAPFSY